MRATAPFRLGAALALALVVPAAAQQPAPNELPTVLRGMGADPRDRVNVNEPPWRALGRFVATVGSLQVSCTGALIAPALVLTAAHCLFNERTHDSLPITMMHFLMGYDAGNFSGHARVIKAVIGPGYDPKDQGKTAGSDWAVLTLDQPLGTSDRVLAMRTEPLAVGTAVMIGGYSRDYSQIITADSHCRIVAKVVDAHHHPMIEHDCTEKQGSSGAPVLVLDGRTWSIAGVNIITAREYTRGYASLPSPAQVLP